MVPAPLTASPPETDQVTLPAGMTLNRSAGVPDGPTELQPVQLVSMELAPGLMENAAGCGLPDAVPPPQPAKTKRAGARKLIRIRKNCGRIEVNSVYVLGVIPRLIGVKHCKRFCRSLHTGTN